MLVPAFKSPAFQMAHDIEAVLIAVINADSTEQNWQTILNNNILPVPHYEGDLDGTRLSLHLSMLKDLCCSAEPQIKVADTTDVVEIFNDHEAWAQMLPEVINLLRLYLTLPVTSCTAERSFSSLRRLKTFLRTINNRTQKRLNHIAILHCHREVSRPGSNLQLVHSKK